MIFFLGTPNLTSPVATANGDSGAVVDLIGPSTPSLAQAGLFFGWASVGGVGSGSSTVNVTRS